MTKIGTWTIGQNIIEENLLEVHECWKSPYLQTKVITATPSAHKISFSNQGIGNKFVSVIYNEYDQGK